MHRRHGRAAWTGGLAQRQMAPFQCRGSAAVDDAVGISRQVLCLQVGQFLRSCQYTLTVTAQTTLAMRLTGGDHAKVARVLSQAMGLSTLLELLLSPLCGRLSDRFGRKPILIAGGLAKLVPYLLMAFRPSMAAIIFCTLLTDASYHTYKLAEGALLADMLPELEPLAIANARVCSMMGAAAVAGPPTGPVHPGQLILRLI